MFKGWMAGLLFLRVLLTVPLPVRANGQAEPIGYNETRTNYIVAIPDAVCGLFYDYLIEGEPGDVVTITAQRLSGDLLPIVNIVEGNQLIPGVSNGETATFENYVLKPGQQYHFFQVASQPGTTGEFTVTITLTGHQEVTDLLPEIGVQSFQVGSRPVHSVWDGQQLYVSNFASQNITVMDVQGQVINTFPFPGNPAAMQWDGSRLWVADRTGDSVYVFDPAGNQLASYQVGAIPISMSYTESLDYIWIALYEDSQVVALDMEGKELTRIDTPAKPSTILTEGASSAWVTLYGDEDNPGDQVIMVATDGKTYETYDVYDYPDDLAWDGENLYVSYGGSPTLTQIDFFDDDRMDYQVSQGNIIDMAWDGSHLWLTLDSNEIIAAETGDLWGDYFEEVLRLPTDARPFGVTYAAPYLWVSNRGTQNTPGSTIMRIDTTALFK